MPEEVRIWSITDGDKLTEIPSSSLNLEARIEDWLDRDISILDPDLLVIGRQVKTDFGGFIDLLCLDSAGDLVVVELKRDKTPREITAQILDYGSWAKDLSSEQITSIAEARLGAGGLEAEFKRRFEAPLPRHAQRSTQTDDRRLAHRREFGEDRPVPVRQLRRGHQRSDVPVLQTPQRIGVPRPRVPHRARCRGDTAPRDQSAVPT